MSDCFPRSSLTNKAADPAGVYPGATMTLMWNAQIQPEPQSNSNSHSFVIQLQTARSNGQSKNPVTTVLRTSREKGRSTVRRVQRGLNSVPYQPTLLDDPRRAVSSARLPARRRTVSTSASSMNGGNYYLKLHSQLRCRPGVTVCLQQRRRTQDVPAKSHV